MWRAKKVEPLILWYFFLLRSYTSSLPFSVLLLTVKLLLTFSFASLSKSASMQSQKICQWTIKYISFFFLELEATIQGFLCTLYYWPIKESQIHIGLRSAVSMMWLHIPQTDCLVTASDKPSLYLSRLLCHSAVSMLKRHKTYLA